MEQMTITILSVVGFSAFSFVQSLIGEVRRRDSEKPPEPQRSVLVEDKPLRIYPGAILPFAQDSMRPLIAPTSVTTKTCRGCGAHKRLASGICAYCGGVE
jgi:hypothetical protein